MAKNKKTFKEFYKTYNAYLLRMSHSRYTVGDFANIENRFFLNIENKSIIDELIDEAEVRKGYRTYLDNLAPIKAELPDISFDNDFLVNLNLPIPNLKINIGTEFKTEKVISCQFEDVWTKVLDNSNDNEIRLKLNKIFDNLKRKDRRNLRKDIGPLKNAFIVEELYYARNVSLNVKQGFGLKADVEEKIKGEGVKVKTDVDENSNHSYIFECNELTLPFAAKIISLEEL